MTYESSSAASDVNLAPFGLRIIRAMQPSAARGETAESVAKRKPASSVSGEQSDRQPSAGASRPTGPQLAASTDADSARTRGRVASVEMPARGWIEETRGPTKGVLLTVITSLGAVLIGHGKRAVR